MVGALLYCLLEPLLPHPAPTAVETAAGKGDEAAGQSTAAGGAGRPPDADALAALLHEQARLLRLGLLMALAMTLHNLPGVLCCDVAWRGGRRPR